MAQFIDFSTYTFSLINEIISLKNLEIEPMITLIDWTHYVICRMHEIIDIKLPK